MVAAAALGGCEVPVTPTPARIDGAEHITFRCAPRDSRAAELPPLAAPGAPLDGCGCTTVGGDGLTFIDDARCAAGNAEVRAYVGSNARGEVSIVNVTRDANRANRRILDVEQTIPGVNGVFIDDVISAVETDPDGRFVFTVNSSTGTVSIVRDDNAVRPALTIDPGVGPLLHAAVWPRPERPITRPAPGGTVALDGRRRAWISAPAAGQVVEIDLDAVARLADGEPVDPATEIVSALYALPPGGVPSRLAVHPDGTFLYVGEATRPRVVTFDLGTGRIIDELDLSRRPTCGNGYLTAVTSLSADPTCSDGLDNDGDGLIDEADSACVGEGPSEAEDPACPQRWECGDGIDNNGDGTVDLDDPLCADNPRWEREPPACSDGEDNDEDGLTDAHDTGCSDEADDSEDPAGPPIETGDDCNNGVDDDLDGLTDGEDPGCTDPEFAPARFADERLPRCADEVDNDADGLVDFPADPDCYAASDDAEGGARLEIGPTELLTARVPVNDGYRTFLFAVEPGGYLVVIDLDSSPLRSRFTRLRGSVQAMALRQYGPSNAILAMLADDTLRSMEITEPTPLRTADNREIYARLPDAWFQSADVQERILESIGPVVRDFYVVEDGSALRVASLDGACEGPAFDAEANDGEGACAAGSERVLDACVPLRCDADDGCGGARCLGVQLNDAGDVSSRGFCMQSCAEDAECGAWAFCDLDLEGGACRSRCSFDDRSVLHLAPSAGCVGDGCGAACAADADCGSADLSCQGGVCATWCEAGDCRAPFDLAEAISSPVDLVANGSVDPMVLQDDDWWVTVSEANVRITARDRTPRVTEPPRMFVGSAVARTEIERFPAFCQLPQPREGEAAGEPTGDVCVPVGYTADGREESSANIAERLRYRVDAYEGIQVIDENRSTAPSEDFTLAFEGDLPGTVSRTGLHGGMVDLTVDSELLRPEAVAAGLVDGDGNTQGWVLLDQSKDFCRRGVEVGDMVIIDRLVPANDAQETLDTCEPFISTSSELPPDQRRDPIRYRVAELTARKLVLRPDGLLTTERADYNDMKPRSERVAIDRLASAPLAPPQVCAGQLTTYRVRTSDQWLLTGNRSGYRHPWVRRDGQCEIDPQRARRRGRVTWGLPFENEWLRFHLGGLADPEDARLPHMVDVAFTFPVVNGIVVSALVGEIIVPQGMRWLPNNDRLYIVDGALQTIVEVGGLDVFRQAMTLFRRYE